MIHQEKLEHLQMLIATAIFNPLLLGLLILIYFSGWILGSFIPWNVVRPLLWVYVAVLALKLTVWHYGYDMLFLFGFPFMGGLWTGSKRRGDF